MPPITRVQWSASNLPTGVTLSSSGLLSGRPTVDGDFIVPITVATNWGSATKNISISVESDIVEEEVYWTTETISADNTVTSINSDYPNVFYVGTPLGKN